VQVPLKLPFVTVPEQFAPLKTNESELPLTLALAEPVSQLNDALQPF
jgi:hypothetical protein